VPARLALAQSEYCPHNDHAAHAEDQQLPHSEASTQQCGSEQNHNSEYRKHSNDREDSFEHRFKGVVF